MIKQNFYQGQKVTPSDINQGLSDYADGLTARLQADILGAGLIQGFGAEIINGFVMGIGPGLAYNANGQRLYLKQGVQINLAAHTPAVGTKWVKIWGILEYTKTQPVIDGEGNTVYTHWEETSAFGSGDTIPEGALHFYDVQLSTGAILIINPAYPLLETPLAQSRRTKGYGYNEGNPKITAPNGFEVDLLTLATRRAVFDLLKPGGYAKGDILWLEPPSHDTQSTPPKLPTAGGVAYPYTVPAATAFMGKARTHSGQTDFRQYAVRLRALKDNPRNPNIIGAIGTDWAVDDPAAIVEEGSNANGSYTVYAGRKCEQIIEMKNNFPAGAFSQRREFAAFPISFSTAPTVGNVWLNFAGGSFNVTTSPDINAEMALIGITASSAEFMASTNNTAQAGGTRLKAKIEGIV